MSQDIPEGILQTSVTWAEFECQLRSALKTEARFGPDKSVHDIGDGNGFASFCVLITCDWVGATGEEKLPSSVVLKIPSNLPMRRLNDSLPEGQKMFDFDEQGWANVQKENEQIHNVEVATYEYFSEFEGLAVPRMYYGRPAEEGSENGQICFEYVENSRIMQFHERHSVDQVKQIARALGKIQACSLKKQPSNPLLQQEFFKMLMETWPQDTFRSIFKGLLELDNSAKTKQLMENIDALLPKFYEFNLSDELDKLLSVKQVLVNGDLHTGNILIDKDTGELASLIDWQNTHLGIGVEDLHRIAMSALFSTDRRTAMPMLIEEMHKSMVENLGDIEPPYSLDVLIFLADLVYLHCALYFAGTCIPIISKVDTDRTLSDEEKTRRKAIMLDKVLGILEDLDEKSDLQFHKT